jgi:hypothetical protein
MEQRDEDLVREHEQAAADEAGRIGGTAPTDVDEARRPVDEAGGGQAEGFEAAEESLIDHAEHTTGEGVPRLDQMGEEAEVDPSVHGQADEPRPAQ